jgi:hypothetical protein
VNLQNARCNDKNKNKKNFSLVYLRTPSVTQTSKCWWLLSLFEINWIINLPNICKKNALYEGLLCLCFCLPVGTSLWCRPGIIARTIRHFVLNFYVIMWSHFTTASQAVPALLYWAVKFCLFKKMSLNTLLPIAQILVKLQVTELHEFSRKCLLFSHIRCNKACGWVKFRYFKRWIWFYT